MRPGIKTIAISRKTPELLRAARRVEDDRSAFWIRSILIRAYPTLETPMISFVKGIKFDSSQLRFFSIYSSYTVYARIKQYD